MPNARVLAFQASLEYFDGDQFPVQIVRADRLIDRAPMPPSPIN